MDFKSFWTIAAPSAFGSYSQKRFLSISVFQLRQTRWVLGESSGVRRIFEKGGGGRKVENNENQKKNFSTQNQSVFLPKLGEDQKKNRSSVRFCPLLCSNFLPKLQRGESWRNFTCYSLLIILYWRPKGGAAMAPCPPKYAPGWELLTDRANSLRSKRSTFLCKIPQPSWLRRG